MPQNANLAELSRYYRSPYWNRVRGLLMYQRDGKCERCGSAEWLQAHHRTYAHLYSELSHMGDLELLCKGCHDGVTYSSRAGRGRGKAGWRPSLKDFFGA